MFGPINEAFKAMPGSLSLPKPTLVDILSYHVSPGYREAPEGFKTGEKMATLLKGKTLGARVD